MLGKETAKKVDRFVDRNQSYMKITKIVFILMRSDIIDILNEKTQEMWNL